MRGNGKTRVIDEIEMPQVSHQVSHSDMKRVKLYIFEEQEILQEAYKASFPAEPSIEVVGVSNDTNVEIIADILAATQPEAVLLGTKMLQTGTITQLEAIRQQFPSMGIVLLSTLYDLQGIKEQEKFKGVRLLAQALH